MKKLMILLGILLFSCSSPQHFVFTARQIDARNISNEFPIKIRRSDYFCAFLILKDLTHSEMDNIFDSYRPGKTLYKETTSNVRIVNDKGQIIYDYHDFHLMLSHNRKTEIGLSLMPECTKLAEGQYEVRVEIHSNNGGFLGGSENSVIEFTTFYSGK